MPPNPFNPFHDRPQGGDDRAAIGGGVGGSGLARVLVQAETIATKGWAYGVRIMQPDGTASEHTVTLAWCDHDYWCGGRLAPSKVIETVLACALRLLPRGSALPQKFDAARLRRLCPSLDSEVRLGGTD